MGIVDFIFYRSTRIGQHGRPFKLWKFRSMVKGADKLGSYSVAADDARVTRLGRILRRTHLDELPNFFNVLKGDMAFIGPRAEIPYYVEKMPPTIKKIVLSVKPGCIDLATLRNLQEGSLLKGKDDPEIYYEKVIWPEKLRLQCHCILKASC